MDFEPHTCLSFTFFPLQVKFLNACWVLLLTQCNHSARSCLSSSWLLIKKKKIFWRMQTANKVHWIQGVSNPNSQGLKLRCSEDVPAHAPSCEWKTQIFSLFMFIGVQRGNKIHGICFYSFHSMFQKVRHNRINREFLTAYHQFWENVHISQQMCLIVDLWT